MRPGSTIPRTRGWGITLALATTVTSGFAVYLNAFGVREWSGAGASSATYTTVKNLIAALLLVALSAALGRTRWRDDPVADGRRDVPSARRRIGLVLVGVIGGSVPFLLFFEGLARASSTQAALIHKSLIIWVAILAVPLLRERIGPMHLAAIALIVAGQVAMAGGITDLGLGSGEVMILGATVLWAAEVVVAKRLLDAVPALTTSVARMGIGSALLVGFIVLTGRLGELSALGAGDWLWAVATGGVLSVYVATWYLGLARAQAVDVTAVLVFAAVITAALELGISGAGLPSALGIGLVTIGALLVVVAMRRRVPVSS
jgi:drug/metabolite transporter (DMT)-like permease